VALEAGGGLLVSVSRRRKVVRLAYDAPHTYGRRGAHWYATHHALARTLSRVTGATVHAYVFDPEEAEEVIGWGNGRRVGGERVVYEDVELPEPRGGETEEQAFERLKSRWPLGHLAYVFGLERDELLRLPRAQAVLLPLERPGCTEALGALDAPGALEALLRLPPVRRLGSADSAA
jgi:hypothetical protein